MKARKVSIVYNFGSLDSVAKAERTYDNLIEQFQNEGREILHEVKDSIRFKDGSVIDKVAIGKGFIGKRLTHMYIDQSISELDNGEAFITEVLLPCVVAEGIYENVDAEGSPSDRVVFY